MVENEFRHATGRATKNANGFQLARSRAEIRDVVAGPATAVPDPDFLRCRRAGVRQRNSCIILVQMDQSIPELNPDEVVVGQQSSAESRSN